MSARDLEITPLTDEEKAMVDELAKSISKLLHMVVSRKLEQFFEVIKAEVKQS